MAHFIVRFFAGGVKRFERSHAGDVDQAALADREDLERLISAYPLHTVEIEFPNEPDPLQRYLRFRDGPQPDGAADGIEREELMPEKKCIELGSIELTPGTANLPRLFREIAQHANDAGLKGLRLALAEVHSTLPKPDDELWEWKTYLELTYEEVKTDDQTGISTRR